MRLEPTNIVCPACGNPNHMRRIIGENVEYFNVKCLNCLSYFNFEEISGLSKFPQMKSAINKIPSADVEEVEHGRWIKTVGENGVTSACRCSNCGFGDNRYSLFNYCPICGARMDSGT